MDNSLLYNWQSLLAVGIIILGLGVYAIVFFRNLVKIFLGLEVFSKGIALIFLAAGSANGKLALAQSFVVTYIVIEAVLATVALSLIVHTYQNYGTLDIRKLSKLKG
ncbi:MAG TPA: NADH-quinone oxidoreductase subunit K [bacterium]|nr:NADH-quinone oxidoreductase subunit K [bacterium]